MKFQLTRFDSPAKSICIVDNIGGTYLPIAIALSKHFDKVYYHTVNQSPFPRITTCKIGFGYDNIEVIDTFWDKINLFDIILFTDLYFSDWGKALRAIGKLVWGGCESEQLETNRKLFKDELSSQGMEVAPTVYIKGLNALKEYLMSHPDSWVKLSYFRGEFETFHNINSTHSEVLFNDIIKNTGPLSEELNFVVEQPIKAIAELGTDGWAVNGIIPNNQITGLEVKNSCYIGKAITTNELPQALLDIQIKFQPILQKYNHTGFYSTEVRVGEDGKDYYTDPCVRAGSPPSNTYMELVSNWQDIIYGAVTGQIVEPKFKAKYGVELILKSSYCSQNFLPLIFPDEYKDNIKLKGSFKYDGKSYIIPFKFAGYELEEFGSVVVIGEELETIMKQALLIAESIESYDVRFDSQALENGIKTLQETETALNIKW